MSSSSTTKFESVFGRLTEYKVVRAKRNISKRLQWRILLFSLILVDFLMLWAAFWLAYLIRFNLQVPLFVLWVRPSAAFYQQLMFILIVLWLGVFYLQGLYSRHKLLGGTQEYSSLFTATTMGVLIVVGVSFLDPGFYLARGWLLLSWGLSFIFTLVGRFLVRRGVYLLRKKGFFLTPALIVGANDEGLMLAQQLLQWETSGLDIVGFVDKKTRPGENVLGHLKVLGDMEHLDEVMQENSIEELVLASSAISSRDRMVEIFKKYAFSPKVHIRFSSGLYEIITTGLTINQFAYVPLMGVNPARLSGVEQVMKYIVDYLLTIPALIVLMPVYALIAIAVKLNSPGPIIHKRCVVGLNGRNFYAYKFRSMRVNGDEILASRPDLKAELAQNHKLKEDPRVTRVGKLIRKLSLDELPQLFNVLKGEMSLVGPRMITPEEIEKYDQWDMNLLTVRPGITGLWQVSGRSDVTYEERVRLDMYYIRNWNIWLDVQIIVQTIPAVIKGRGAY